MLLARRRGLASLGPFTVALAVVAVAASAPGQIVAAGDDPLDIELRVWQHVNDAENIWISARPRGARWDTLGTIRFSLDRRSTGYGTTSHHRHGDLAIGGVGLRVWQSVSEPDRIYVEACASACPARERGVPLPWTPLGMLPLPLDEGHSPSGRYRYGDTTVAIPRGAHDLLADREYLLALRDVLEGGRAELNWSPGLPTADWEGVTVGGVPPRVTGLRLSGRGLGGEIWGWIGDLTGLTVLHLDGNALTGTIPSKVSVLTELRDVRLEGNEFAGCVPPSLLAASSSDAGSLGIPDCREPTELRARDRFYDPYKLPPGPSEYREVISAGTYQWQPDPRLYRFVLDVPEDRPVVVEARDGLMFEFFDGVPARDIFEANEFGLVLRDASDEGAWVFLDFETRRESERSHYPGCMHDCAVASVAAIEQVLASVWVDTVAGAVSAADAQFGTWGHFNQKLVHGGPVRVCSEDYPNAVQDAADVWNDGLHSSTPKALADDVNLFVVIPSPCPRPGWEWRWVDYVEVGSRFPWSTDGFCRPTTDWRACTAFVTWEGQIRTYFGVENLYVGSASVIMHEQHRPRHHDAIDDLSNPDYRKVVRTIAQSLGYVLGFSQHDCGSASPADVVDSLMLCSDLAIEAFPETWAFPLQPRDVTDYAAIYKPSTVASQEGQPLATARPPRAVRFSIDYKSLVAFERLEIRRWRVPWAGIPHGPRWVLIRTYTPDGWTGPGPQLFSQVPGPQRYGLFSTTQAYLAGQCYDNDPDCDVSNNPEGWESGEPIGFGRIVDVVVPE